MDEPQTEREIITAVGLDRGHSSLITQYADGFVWSWKHKFALNHRKTAADRDPYADCRSTSERDQDEKRRLEEHYNIPYPGIIDALSPTRLPDILIAPCVMIAGGSSDR